MEKVSREGSNLTVMVLGDEGVGKSSLVSTFVSRHFSEKVPPIITRLRIPPDPKLANCTSTIIDTQEGDRVLSDVLSLSDPRLGSRGSLASIQSSDSTDSMSSWRKKRGIDYMHNSSTFSKHQPAITLLAAGSPYRNVDAIILVYDLDRSETFERLSSHWLPLIAKCYGGELPVIIAGNKMDLQSSSVSVPASTENEISGRSRHEIISLLQKFTFVRQCIKCSAKNLLNIDEVFQMAQKAVLYPITPLYDLNTDRLTLACTRALSRVFRMFDEDSDGLLSDGELNAFQQKVWGVTLMERDVLSWKKVVVEHNKENNRMGDERSVDDFGSPVIQDDKFTLQGFLTIFDIFISQNRLEVPWKVFRSFGYDDNLNLTIPSTMSHGDDFANILPNKWQLTSEEECFLSNIFYQHDSDRDGFLTSNEYRHIFSVLSNPLPPWSERGRNLFCGCPSLPRVKREGASPSSSMLRVSIGAAKDTSSIPPSVSEFSPSSHSIFSASGITVSSSPLPSVDVSKDTTPVCGTLGIRPISYLCWINHWHMMCTISPSIYRIELYRLGFVGKQTVPQQARVQQISSRPTTGYLGNDKPSIIVRALIIGMKNSGSDVLIKHLHGETDMAHNSMSLLDYPETSCSVSTRNEEILHLILTHIPLVDSSNDKYTKLTRLLEEGVYDMALLVYNSSQSFNVVKQFDADMLNENTPRIFTSTDPDHLSIAIDYCEDMKLDQPHAVHIDSPETVSMFIEYLVSYAKRPRRNTSKKRKLIWFGGLVSASIAVVIGFTIGRKRKVGSKNS